MHVILRWGGAGAQNSSPTVLIKRFAGFEPNPVANRNRFHDFHISLCLTCAMNLTLHLVPPWDRKL